MAEMKREPTVVPPSFLRGGKRANLQQSESREDWWVGFGKDEGCQFEGPWSHMAILAAQILSDPATEVVASNLYRPGLGEALTAEQRSNYTEAPQVEWPGSPYRES